LSYASFAIEEGNAEPPANAVKFSEVPPRHEPHAPTNPAMENEFLAVEFDSVTGGVTRLVDKSTGKDLADAANPLGVLELVQERGRGMSAWIIGQIQSRQYPLEVKSLERGAAGPYICSLAAKLKVGASDVTVTYSLKAGHKWLEIQVDATWFERGTREAGTPNLRMRFPVAVENPRGQYEAPFGAVVRSLNHGEEVPALRWADVSGQANASSARAGLALLNDCKYGHSLEGNILRLTLIRSSFEPDPLPEIGEHTIRMAVAPHGSTLATDELIRLGAAFNHPLAVISTDVHKGQLPAVGSAAAAVAPGSVVLSSIRKAQDEDALIVHLYETAGNAVEAQVTLGAKLFGRAGEAVEVDLLERPCDTSTARVTKSGFSVALPAYGIAAVRISVEK
jgi:alpha-mannosidase